MESDLGRAVHALECMYGDWEQGGGVSPSVRDESYAVALAIGVADMSESVEFDGGAYHLVDDATLDVIYNVAQDGAEVEQIAQLHVDALRWASGSMSGPNPVLHFGGAS